MMPVISAVEAQTSLRRACKPATLRAVIQEDLTAMFSKDALGDSSAKGIKAIGGKTENDGIVREPSGTDSAFVTKLILRFTIGPAVAALERRGKMSVREPLILRHELGVVRSDVERVLLIHLYLVIPSLANAEHSAAGGFLSLHNQTT